MKFSIENLSNLKELIRELATGLLKLDFDNNFESFEYSDTVPANTEVRIRNQLKFTPGKYIIGYSQGNALVTAGDTEWTKDYVYIKNHDATNEAIVKITFMR